MKQAISLDYQSAGVKPEELANYSRDILLHMNQFEKQFG